MKGTCVPCVMKTHDIVESRHMCLHSTMSHMCLDFTLSHMCLSLHKRLHYTNAFIIQTPWLHMAHMCLHFTMYQPCKGTHLGGTCWCVSVTCCCVLRLCVIKAHVCLVEWRHLCDIVECRHMCDMCAFTPTSDTNTPTSASEVPSLWYGVATISRLL